MVWGLARVPPAESENEAIPADGGLLRAVSETLSQPPATLPKD